MPLLFFVFWVILNGKFTLEIALFGVAISFAVYFFSHRFLGYSIKGELRLYRCILRYAGYVVLMIWEIAKANMDVLKLIYKFKYKPDSVLIHFDSDIKTTAARTALANSITLTPGTITVFQEEEGFTVHCLDKSFADGIEESSFVQHLRKTEQMLEKNKQKNGRGEKA